MYTVTQRLAVGLVLVALLLGCQGTQGTAGPGGPPDMDATPGAAFPVTVEHKYGATDIAQEPERIVTVGFNDQDFVLALGVVPVAERQFLGGLDMTDRPWAREALGDARPELVGAEEIDFEQVAALEPDLILGLYSALTEDEYATLSQIAPTVAQPGEYIDFGIPWTEQMRRIGQALGQADRADEIVAEVEARFDDARTAHPEFEGTPLVLAAAEGTEQYVYGSGDLRTQFFTALGFRTPAEIDELAGDVFFAQIDREQLTLLDQDALVVYGDEALLGDSPVFGDLDVVAEGRVLYLEQASDPATALGFSSPLSLPFALDAFVPRLAAAVDGDPSTPVEPEEHG